MAQILSPVSVGRDAPLRELEAVIEAVRGGRGGITTVVGEAGWGKSRLLRAAASRARERGVLVLTGRAAGTAPEPYRPLAEAVVGALRAADPPDTPELRPFRSALGRLVPAWHRPGESSTSTVFLAEGLLRLLRVLGSGRGVLLVLEDLHDSDPETLDVLEHLAGGVDDQPVACLLSLRPQSAALVDRLHRLARRSGGRGLDLAPLSMQDVEAMARACLGTAELPTTLPTLLERADGVPLLVEQVLAAAVDSGALVRRDDVWTHRPEPVAPVPTTLAEVTAYRLATLPPTGHRILAAAALLGPRFDWSLVGPAVGVADREVLAVLRLAADAQLLVLDDGAFRFHHSLIADAVLDRLVTAERGALASALLAGLPEHDELAGGVRATLEELAGRAEAAARTLVTAGRRALEQGSTSSARAFGERARTLVGDGPGRPAVDDLLLEEASYTGDVDRAVTLAGRLRPPEGDPHARVQLLVATAALAGGRWALAAERIGDVLASAEDRDLRLRAEATAAQVHLEVGDLGRARDDALGAADAPAPEVACQALEVLGRLARQRDPDEAREHFQRQRDRARVADLPRWHLRALHQLGTLELQATLRTDGLLAARGEAERMGLRARVATIDLQLAANEASTFVPDAGLERIRSCVATARRADLALLPEALVIEAHVHGLAGRTAAMDECLVEAWSYEPDEELRAVADGRCHGLVALLAEDRVGGRHHLEAALAAVVHRPGAVARPYFGLWPLLVALSGPDDEATRAVRIVRNRGAGIDGIEAGVDLAEAVLAGRRGRVEQADAAVRRADRRLAPYGSRFDGYRYLMRRLLAEAALTDGWGSPASWFLEASEYFRVTGHRPVEDACRAGIRLAGGPVPRRSRRPLPAILRARGVTEREAEVLEMLVGGLTNRAIAESLVISLRTVEKHVERLLTKTGTSDRHRLAALVGASSEPT